MSNVESAYRPPISALDSIQYLHPVTFPVGTVWQRSPAWILATSIALMPTLIAVVFATLPTVLWSMAGSAIAMGVCVLAVMAIRRWRQPVDQRGSFGTLPSTAHRRAMDERAGWCVTGGPRRLPAPGRSRTFTPRTCYTYGQPVPTATLRVRVTRSADGSRVRYDLYRTDANITTENDFHALREMSFG